MKQSHQKAHSQGHRSINCAFSNICWLLDICTVEYLRQGSTLYWPDLPGGTGGSEAPHLNKFMEPLNCPAPNIVGQSEYSRSQCVCLLISSGPHPAFNLYCFIQITARQHRATAGAALVSGSPLALAHCENTTHCSFRGSWWN